MTGPYLGDTDVPTYEYRCQANGAVIEVQHKMAEQLHTWGELCARAGIPRGKTSSKARVEKLMSAGFVSTGSSQSAGAECAAPLCGTGACGGGMCGMN
jgi:predicted nucleic acid-binding Zn ribbon protein